MIRIIENMVLQYESEEHSKIRIIWINPSNKHAYFVSLKGSTSMPQIISLSNLRNQIEDETLLIVPDPYIINIQEENIPAKYKKIRDENWSIISEVWTNDKEILIKSKRKNILKEAAKKHNISEKKVKRILSRFWQRGMTKNALLPDYSNSGAKGKKRTPGNRKRGRPRKYSNRSVGINIDENILNIFKKSLQQFYHNKKRKSLKETYTLMLKKYFSNEVDINGERVYKIWDEDRIPTYEQFYYWYEKINDSSKEFIARNSKTKFNLNNRELLSDSTIGVFGPGAKYQIDATVADVFLVSEIMRDRIIGRPIIYIVIDVFSRLVVGIYVGLEGPSWIGAMMALDNVVENKVEFCRKYGVAANEDDWPNSYLPETILADRGEFEGYNPENLINNLNIKIENTPPYRGDLKGIVERKFRTINTKIKHTTPGAIQKQYRERGDKPYWLDATLDLKQFTEIIIHLIINHNNSIISDYPRQKKMIEDNVLPIPKELWKWGLDNRRCGFIMRDRDIIRLNLLPKGKASLSRKGLRFKKAYYSSEKAIKEQWFINSSRRSIEILYDPRNINYIYIPEDNGSKFTKCYLVEKSEKYKNLCFEEVLFMNRLDTEQISTQRREEKQLNVNLEDRIEKIIDKAKDYKRFSNKNSDTTRTKGIRKNREIEKENNRKNESFELGVRPKISNSEIIDIHEENENYKPKSKIDLLRRSRDRERGK